MGGQTTVRLGDDLQEHLEAYLEQSRFEIEKSSVMRLALREFFAREAARGDYDDSGLPDLEVDLEEVLDVDD